MSSPGELEISCGVYRVVLADAGHAADPTRYPLVYSIEDKRCRPSSCHTVAVFEGSGEVKSCLLTAGSGATGVHVHSAVCVGTRGYVAVGDSVCALSVPALDLVWHSAVDRATCFGVYHVPEYDCLISHGELTITRLDWSGKIVWQAGGPDIFTEGFVIIGGIIEATDWNKTTFRIDIETGRIVDVLPPAHGA